MRDKIIAAAGLILLLSCNSGDLRPDASGTFESDEVIVSAQASGQILDLKVNEGQILQKDSIVGTIDPTDLALQKEQTQASIAALSAKTADAGPQIRVLRDQLTVQQTQLDNLQHEQTRTENLLKEDAATKKQLDDITYQIESVKKQMDVTNQQIESQQSNIAIQNRGILSEGKPLAKKVDQLNEMLARTNITNPVRGTVLAKYAEAGEVTATGKAMYKIADLSSLNLRAYITGDQLPQIKLGQQVTVRIDSGAKHYKSYTGSITWISDKAEFTPKTIQTKDERANLVYAVKIKVVNDGFLKIGMYGEVLFIQTKSGS